MKKIDPNLDGEELVKQFDSKAERPKILYDNADSLIDDIEKQTQREEFIKNKIMEQVELNSALDNNKMLASIRGALQDIPEIGDYDDDELYSIILNWRLKKRRK